ncbi:endophilin-B2 isoform X9 [Pipistrellus kuhlii]|uniref:endophilin-B2 isoform X9 n=1 Tax=Pipistrellus kuhlii TaxID=59472 RepID=UPI001E274240|nr:endophilin-B2 isoform X9 [Pipistrellus kuhlii]
MDFNMKKLASDAGIFFTRAVQFTEEKFGQAEKTELDANFENLLARADSTKNWTEKILRQTEVLLQPNPSARVEEFLYEKLDRKVPSRVTNGELLAQYMAEAASELGPTTPYGKTLIKVSEAEKRLGAAERDFIHAASINFLTPLRNFLEGDWKTISKERRLLQNRRLDLDVCKARLKKAKAAEAKAATVPDFQETRPRNYILSASASARYGAIWHLLFSLGARPVSRVPSCLSQPCCASCLFSVLPSSPRVTSARTDLCSPSPVTSMFPCVRVQPFRGWALVPRGQFSLQAPPVGTCVRTHGGGSLTRWWDLRHRLAPFCLRVSGQLSRRRGGRRIL